jgi:polysaccharide pyruvyl transferase WcaK-like protein
MLEDNIPKISYKSTHSNKAFVYIPHQRILNKAQISVKHVATSFVSACENFGAAPIVAVLNREDLALAQKMQKFSPKIKVVKPENTQQLISLMKNASLCITQRYHGALFSLPLEMPTLILSNDPKLIGLCKELNLPTPQEISVIGETKALNRAIIDTQSFFSHSANRISNVLIARAKRTDKLIAKIFSHYI